MAERTSVRLSQIITLLQELKGELAEARADIRWLKKKAGFGQKPPRRRAIISVPSDDGYSTESIELSIEDWRRVKRGDTVKIRGPGIQVTEKISYWDDWEFSGGIGGSVKTEVRDKEDESHAEIEFEGRFELEFVEEIDEPPKKRSTAKRG